MDPSAAPSPSDSAAEAHWSLSTEGCPREGPWPPHLLSTLGAEGWPHTLHRT